MILPKLTKQLTKVYGPTVRLRSLSVCKDGRRRVDLIVNGRQKTCLVARLKLEVKLKRPLERGESVDHKDDDKTNDRFGNLQLLSLGDNVRKSRPGVRLANRGVQLGEDNGQAKLSDNEAFEIRKKFSRGVLTFDQIKQQTRLSPGSVKNLLSGRTYRHVGGPLTNLEPRKRGRPRKSEAGEIGRHG